MNDIKKIIKDLFNCKCNNGYKVKSCVSESLLQEQMDSGKLWNPKDEQELDNKVNKPWVKIAFYIV